MNQVSLNDPMSAQGWTLLTCVVRWPIGLPVIYFPSRAVKLTGNGQFLFLPRIMCGVFHQAPMVEQGR